MRSQVTARVAGFTLIELMVVVVIGAILASIAVSMYQNQVQQSRRTEAKTALLDLAGREESYFSTNGFQYTNTAGNLGYNGWPATTPNGYYQITFGGATGGCVAAQGSALGCDAQPGAPNGPAYYLTATPLGSQAKDAQCGSFAVDSLGNQYSGTALGTGNWTSAQCWAQ